VAARVPAPTPKEIEERAREIRKGWSQREKKKRCAYETEFRCPQVSPAVFAEAAGPQGRRLQRLY
jgi:hypothetical protein